MAHGETNIKKKKRLLLAHADYSNISNCRTKILTIFRGILNYFLLCTVFTQLFLPEPLTMFCGTLRSLFQKHRFKGTSPRYPLQRRIGPSHSQSRRLGEKIPLATAGSRSKIFFGCSASSLVTVPTMLFRLMTPYTMA